MKKRPVFIPGGHVVIVIFCRCSKRVYIAIPNHEAGDSMIFPRCPHCGLWKAIFVPALIWN